MAKRQVKNKVPSQRWKLYEVKDGKIIRKNPTSPKEGPGIFMAVHKNRKTCGKSGYTEFTKTEKKEE
ncbi:30S ribosomal protein S27ae [Candidatus Woesearchaeota archaeon]|jgi:ubiquitin-small subunit ribosomal protein S27Ae|nr:30S ribosomal protein S27ae [Candidatus Woesearchaeota archaeon]MBT5215948.1 30S ribosomal protein S27ae [Candidatus Woesearchaeota archaeon]MBT6402339.1 30S ribosomal protein S27ae [Candidatus Woesearchaeota archaeon]